METQSGKIGAVMVSHFGEVDVFKNVTLPTLGVM